RAYEIAELRYREGVASLLELTDTRLLLEEALANRAVAARDLQVAQARLALLPALPLGVETGLGAGGVTGGTEVPGAGLVTPAGGVGGSRRPGVTTSPGGGLVTPTPRSVPPTSTAPGTTSAPRPSQKAGG